MICDRCSTALQIDCIVDDAIFARITGKDDGSGVLCPRCMATEIMQVTDWPAIRMTDSRKETDLSHVEKMRAANWKPSVTYWREMYEREVSRHGATAYAANVRIEQAVKEERDRCIAAIREVAGLNSDYAIWKIEGKL